MEGVQSAERNRGLLPVTLVQHLPEFPGHIGSQFDQTQFASGDILQDFSVKPRRITGLEDAFGFLAPERGPDFVEGDPGGDGLGGSARR